MTERCLAKDPAHRYQHANEVVAALEAVEPTDRQGGRPDVVRDRPSRRSWVIGSGVAALFTLLVGAGLLDRGGVLPGIEGAPITSVAVLPLDNLMNSSDQAYFVDGMTEALIAELARVGELRVISRTSAMQYAERDQPLPAIARELGVEAIVEGSVLRAGGQVRITAQLIDGRTDEHVWAGTYERELTDVLRLQREVAAAIAVEIHGTLSPQATGRHYLNRRTESDLNLARDYFETAIKTDQSYAVAHAGLADTYTLLGVYGTLSGTEAGALAKASARRALQLDPELAEGHTALGYALFTYDWDWVAAERSLRRAADLRPNDSANRHWYATLLMATGRSEAATREIAAARSLDPLSPLINSAVGRVDFYAGRYEEAVRSLTDVVAKAPEFRPARLYLVRVYLRQDRLADAIAELESLTGDGGAVEELAELAGIYALEGRRTDAEELLRRVGDPPASGAVPVALARYRMSEPDEALRFLTTAYEQRSAMMVTLTAPDFDGLRNDPVFQDLFNQINFPPQP